MSRGGTFLLVAVAALAVACGRPADLKRRLVLSADEVVFYVKSDDVPTQRVWVMEVDPEEDRGQDVTVSVEPGAEWLSATVDPLRDHPYAIVLKPRIDHFTAEGSYSAIVAIQRPGAEVKRVRVQMYVLAPELRPSTNRVLFAMQGGSLGTPPPRTVLVAVEPGAGGFKHGAPSATVRDQTCGAVPWDPGDWLDAQFVTSGDGFVATLTPIDTVLRNLLPDRTCHAVVELSASYDTVPPGAAHVGGGTLIDVTLTIGFTAPPLVEASTDHLAFEMIPGTPPPAEQTFSVVGRAGAPLADAIVSASDPLFTVSVSGGPPLAVTVGLRPQASALPPGQRFATVTIVDPATAASTTVPVSLQVWQWDSEVIGLPATGATLTSLGGSEYLFAGGQGDHRGAFTVESARLLPSWPADFHGLARGSMMTPRMRHTATSFAPGHVIAAGGLDPVTSEPVGTWEIFDAPHAHTWYVQRPLLVPRFAHTATALLDGRVLVAGGAVGRAAYPTTISDVEILDPGEPDPTTLGKPTPAWSARSVAATPMARERRGASAVLLPRGKVLVAGGLGRSGAPLDSAEIFDPATGSWSHAGSMNVARADFALIPLADGRVLAAGGTDGERALADAEVYDPVHDSWTVTRPMSVARSAPGVRLPSGRVLLVGGLTGPANAANAESTVERFDPLTETWTFAAPVGAIAMHAVTVLDDGLVVIAGGAEVVNGVTRRMLLEGLYGYGEVP